MLAVKSFCAADPFLARNRGFSESEAKGKISFGFRNLPQPWIADIFTIKATSGKDRSVSIEDECHSAPAETEHCNRNNFINKKAIICTFPLLFAVMTGNSESANLG
jgi:hypothetical protein